MSDLNGYGFVRQTDHLSKVPLLAARLGVKPVTHGDATVLLYTSSGMFDAFDLINAVLDRLDAATKESR